MADYVEVNTDILQSDINQLNEHLNRIESQLSQMYGQVEELNTLWKGQANAAFSTQFRQDNETMKDVISELKKYSESLSQARVKYDKCEDSVQDMVNSIQI